jgi:aspartate aminotransferase
MVSNRIKNIVPSATEAFSAKAAALKKKGVDLVSFCAGEPDVDTPPHIVAAVVEAMNKAGHSKYTVVPGILELREAICAKLSADNSLAYKPSEIVVSAGAKNSLGNTMLAICNPGDEVILPTPCWVSYTEIIKLADAVPVFVPTDQGRNFGLDLDLIRKAITRKTRAIIINTPNNPTGAVYPQDVLTALAELALKHNFYVISDEIYEKLIYGSARHFSIGSLSPEMKAHCITINGFSKAYAMTGWRLGYSAAPEDISEGINALQSHTITNATSIVQYAGLAALRGSQDTVETMHRQAARYAGN